MDKEIANISSHQHHQQHHQQRHHGDLPRTHFLPHQQLSSPAFPTSPQCAAIDASLRRFSEQQQNSVEKPCWNESLEQLSRDLQIICKSGSRDNLWTTNATNATNTTNTTNTINTTNSINTTSSSGRPTTPSSQSRCKTGKKYELPERRVSLNVDFIEGLSHFKKERKKAEENPLKYHGSHEDLLASSPAKFPRGILKQSSQNRSLTSTDFDANDLHKNGDETNDHGVFENQTRVQEMQSDFGFPEAILRKIKVRHEETEVSLSRTLAKICRSKNIFLVQKEPQDCPAELFPSPEEGCNSENLIQNQLEQLSAPVVVVGNIRQLIQQSQQVAESVQWTSGESKEIKKDSEARAKQLTMESHRQHSKARDVLFDKKQRTPISPIQAYRRKRLLRLSREAKSLGRSFEAVGIQLRVELNDRNPYGIGVSVDEESGFLTVFGLTCSKNPSYESGLGDSGERSSSSHNPSISSDASETPIVSSVEQLHLLKIGESTKAECLKCSIEEGILRIRETECEAEFLDFEGTGTKYLPIVMEDFVDCRISVSLFVPREFRDSTAVKTVDDILVLSGTKGREADKFGSSRECSDDDDGYEAASEKSCHSSPCFTPPAASSPSFRARSPPTPGGSLSSASPRTALPFPAAASFKVALNLPPETITRSICAWMAECGQLIVAGLTTGVGRRMTCNF